MSREELLEEAKERFPIDTVFNNSKIIDARRANQIVKGNHRHDGDDIIAHVEGGFFTIYRDGKWADIISRPVGCEPIYSIY